MKTITTVAEIQTAISNLKAKGKTVGFAPTMGALHRGHMSLMKASNDENDITVCSVFVNPTQFNEKTDLDKYPRTLAADEKLLKKNGVDIVFAPTPEEVYPKTLKTELNLDFKGLDKEMEGEFRPGHFEGVAQVVKRLLDIVTPEALYMGQKDFQQFTLVHYMMTHFNFPTQLRVIPIVREDTGLAMSSRNVRLTTANKANAVEISKVLKYVKRNKYKKSCADLQNYAMSRLAKIPEFKPEYFTIADARTLRSIKNCKDSDYVVACTAVWAGEVRLIDNMVLRKPRGLKIFV
ncbi:MAG: pantoate--beta-alanine ligase [Saprospiraceae bacterium]|jgi:pantoate--beta-alanine ligase|tara:strand:+ start:893 stop:1768 length:876 start_codon:yes stop_codon:yes gene_type:complete